MSNLLFVGMVILAICIYFSRSISKEALELLSEEEKHHLEKQFSRFDNRLYLLPIIIGFFAYAFISYVQPSFSNPAFVLLILFFLFFLFFTSTRVIRKMKVSGLPDAYVREYKQSRWIYNIGFALCGIILLYELLK
ncbi:MAG: hypothetical protein WC836_03125 [Desulfobacula sp.]|jgi:uncharacterized membrane protein YfcA